ncbi:hypothetical protein TNCV_4044131 [Trichonephila clavipes]|nr:hypothetical protein TNCV_4044131 [Trichonephila clavipes]
MNACSLILKFLVILKLLVTNLVTLNKGKETRTTPELVAHSPDFRPTPIGKLRTSTDFTSSSPSIRWVISRTTNGAYDSANYEFETMTILLPRPG